MEANAAAIEGLRERLVATNDRVTGVHRGVSDLRQIAGAHGEKIVSLEQAFLNQTEDMKELKGQMRSIGRGMWVAAATLASFTLALATLVVAILSNG